VVLRLSSRGRRSAPRRRREARAERPGVPAGQLRELRLREVYLQAASFRQPAAYPEAAPDALAERPEVSSSRHLRRVAVVYRAASSVLRQREALAKAFRPVARRSPVPVSKAPRSAASPSAQAMHPASPAHAWRQQEEQEAARCEAARPEVSALRHLRREVKAAWSV